MLDYFGSKVIPIRGTIYRFGNSTTDKWVEIIPIDPDYVIAQIMAMKVTSNW